MKGDDLPVSAFVWKGRWYIPMQVLAAYEKRGIAVTFHLNGNLMNCIQCNQCSYVCPHAAIRPFLLTEEELENAPAGTKTIQGVGGASESF